MLLFSMCHLCFVGVVDSDASGSNPCMTRVSAVMGSRCVRGVFCSDTGVASARCGLGVSGGHDGHRVDLRAHRGSGVHRHRHPDAATHVATVRVCVCVCMDLDRVDVLCLWIECVWKGGGGR